MNGFTGSGVRNAPSPSPICLDFYFLFFYFLPPKVKSIHSVPYVTFQLFHNHVVLPLWESNAGEMQQPCIHFLITTLSQHSDALSRNLLIFSEDDGDAATATFSFLFFLYMGDGGQAGEADAPICSVKQTDLLPRAPPSSACPPYRVTAVPKKGHCGRLRKRRKAVKGDGRVDAGARNKVERWIPGGPEKKVAPSGRREPPVDSVPGERPLDRRGQGGNTQLCFFFCVIFCHSGICS